MRQLPLFSTLLSHGSRAQRIVPSDLPQRLAATARPDPPSVRFLILEHNVRFICNVQGVTRKKTCTVPFVPLFSSASLDEWQRMCKSRGGMQCRASAGREQSSALALSSAKSERSLNAKLGWLSLFAQTPTNEDYVMSFCSLAKKKRRRSIGQSAEVKTRISFLNKDRFAFLFRVMCQSGDAVSFRSVCVCTFER